MKRTIILIAAACTLFAACNKEKMPSGNEFSAGEKVTIQATACTEAATKVEGLLNAQDKISFKWETGDKIKVTIGTKSSEFTLIEGAGTATATFEGAMPADGNTFDVQFPTTDPVLSSQDYVADGLPHNKIKATATGCTLGTAVNLVPVNCALRLKLFGKDKTVGKLVITDKTAEPNVSYTLNSPADGVAVGATSAAATSFFAVLPEGSRKFTVDVYDNEATKEVICSYETSSPQTFTAGQVLVMPAKKVQVPSPQFSVSATKKVSFSKANIYWDGSALKFESTQYAQTTSYSASHVANFYYSTTLSGAVGQNAPSLSGSEVCYFAESAGGVTVEGESGLYILTPDEWRYLLSADVSGRSTSLRKTGVTVGGTSNCLVIAPDGYKGAIADSYTEEEWAAAEVEGLVCIASNGLRYYHNGLSAMQIYNTDVFYCLTAGLRDDVNVPFFVKTFEGNPSVENSETKTDGVAVRLVRTYVDPTDIGSGTLSPMTGSNGAW